MKKTLDQLRAFAAAENEACRRLEAAGYWISGWDARTGKRVVIRYADDDKFHLDFGERWEFPTWQAAAAQLLA